MVEGEVIVVVVLETVVLVDTILGDITGCTGGAAAVGELEPSHWIQSDMILMVKLMEREVFVAANFAKARANKLITLSSRSLGV